MLSNEVAVELTAPVITCTGAAVVVTAFVVTAVAVVTEGVTTEADVNVVLCVATTLAVAAAEDAEAWTGDATELVGFCLPDLEVDPNPRMESTSLVIDVSDNMLFPSDEETLPN